MERKGEHIFAHGLGWQVVLQGVMFAVLTLTGFVLGRGASGNIAAGRTMAFLVLALTQVVHSFNMRSEHSVFRIGPFTNRTLTGAAALSLVLIAGVVFIPGASYAFGLTRLTSGGCTFGQWDWQWCRWRCLRSSRRPAWSSTASRLTPSGWAGPSCRRYPLWSSGR